MMEKNEKKKEKKSKKKKKSSQQPPESLSKIPEVINFLALSFLLLVVVD